MLFLGLFLILGGAERVGVTQELLGVAERLNLHNPVIFAAVVTLLSNMVSNVPAVMLLKGLPPQIHDAHTAWLLLAMSSTLAGNVTITGSIANIIVVEKARTTAHHQLCGIHEDWGAGNFDYACHRPVLAHVCSSLTERDFGSDAIWQKSPGGEAFFSTSVWRGIRCMRISVLNWRTSEKDVDRAVSAVSQACKRKASHEKWDASTVT